MPRFSWLLVLLVLIGAPVLPVHALTTDPKALPTCVKTALRQVMILRRVISEKPIYDSRRRLVQSVIVMDVNAAGQKREVTCVYDVAAGTARILPPPPVKPALPASDSIAACKRTAQSHGYVIEAVTGQTDLRDKAGKTVGRRVAMTVSRKGKASRMICDHDFSSGAIGLEILR